MRPARSIAGIVPGHGVVQAAHTKQPATCSTWDTGCANAAPSAQHGVGTQYTAQRRDDVEQSADNERRGR